MVDDRFDRHIKRPRWHLLLAVLVCVPLLTSCTKEKAEALKVAAHKLRDDMSQSLTKVRQLYKLGFETYLPDDRCIRLVKERRC